MQQGLDGYKGLVILPCGKGKIKYTGLVDTEKIKG